VEPFHFVACLFTVGEYYFLCVVSKGKRVSHKLSSLGCETILIDKVFILIDKILV